MSFAIPLILPQEDANGTISYLEAFQYASELGIDKYFKIDYTQLYGERIDFGELIVWGFDTLYSL